jgi:hypothetical protein
MEPDPILKIGWGGFLNLKNNAKAKIMGFEN